MGPVYFLKFRLNPKGMKNTLKDFNKRSNMIQHTFQKDHRQQSSIHRNGDDPQKAINIVIGYKSKGMNESSRDK